MEYKVKIVKPVGEKDSYGNQGYYIEFEGGESAFMKAVKAPIVGQTEYGVISEEARKDGTGTYKRFRRIKKDEAKPQTNQHNDEGMYWCNALTNAVNLVGQGGDPYEVLDVAKIFFDGRLGKKVEKPETQENDRQLQTEGIDELDLDNISFEDEVSE